MAAATVSWSSNRPDVSTPVAFRRRFEAEALPLLPRLYSGALHLTGNASDAEDLAQETLRRAFRAFHQFREGSNLRFTVTGPLFSLRGGLPKLAMYPAFRERSLADRSR